jgi:hypothetical protein
MIEGTNSARDEEHNFESIELVTPPMMWEQDEDMVVPENSDEAQRVDCRCEGRRLRT